MDKVSSSYDAQDYTTERNTRNTLIHFFLFVLHLTFLTIIGLSYTEPIQYNFINGMGSIMSAGGFNNISMPYYDVRSINDIWYYMEFVFIEELYGSQKYLNKRPKFRGRAFLGENLLLGPPRLRQARVKPHTCRTLSELSKYFDNCYGPFSEQNEFKERYYKGTKFYTMEELGCDAMYGKTRRFYTGGYVKHLSYSKEASLGTIRHLRKIQWLDRGTRMLLVEVTMLNLNTDYLLTCFLSFEVQPNGLVYPRYRGDAFAGHPSCWPWTGLIAASWICLEILNVYFTYHEIYRIVHNGIGYHLSKFSTILTLPSLFFFYLSTILYIVIYDKTLEIRAAIKQDQYKFLNLDTLCNLYFWVRIILGSALLIDWIFLLTFLDFNPVMRTLSSALKIAIRDLSAFFVMFTVAFVACGNLGLILFGNASPQFKDFETSLMTMVRILVCDFVYTDLQERFVMAPPFFLSCVLFINFVLLNICLAALILSYKHAIATAAYKPSFLMYYIRKQIYRITCGFIGAPTYPEWAKQHIISTPLDKERIKELLLIREYTEFEIDMDIFRLRLGEIEKILFCISNNMRTIVEKYLKEYEKNYTEPE